MIRWDDLHWWRSFRSGIVAERLLWWSLIGLGLLGTAVFLGLFGVLIWGLFWGIRA